MGRFVHGVASGDPLADRVVIWTRVTTEAAEEETDWVVARDADLTDVVASGTALAEAEHDHTVHVDVTGLDPQTHYFYAFAAGGERSPTARTKTLPGDDAGRIRFATCSCAKYNAGFFNAYPRMAERADRDELDFLLHLGDYIYEAANKPPASQTPGADIGRPFEPLEECRTLADYRTRYAQYRRDPDVQRLHHALPLLPMLDDHELADGAWAGGATEHRPDEHGPWTNRRDEAFRARWEWQPARPPDPADPTRVFRQVPVGGLADLFLVDIRSRRDEPALEPAMSDPDRSMLGVGQRDWLFTALRGSSAAWRLVATPSIMSRTWSEQPQEPLLTALLKLKLIDEDATGADEDQWDGYPAERAALIEQLAAVHDVAVLSADIHIGLAAELRHGDEPAAVELTAPSLTSQNLDEKLGLPPRAPEIVAAERAFIDSNDLVHWCEFSSHGYLLVDLNHDRLRAEWWHLDTVLERADGEFCAAAYEVPRHDTRLRKAERTGGLAR